MPTETSVTCPVGGSLVGSCFGIYGLTSCALWDWFLVLGPCDV